MCLENNIKKKGTAMYKKNKSSTVGIIITIILLILLVVLSNIGVDKMSGIEKLFRNNSHANTKWNNICKKQNIR